MTDNLSISLLDQISEAEVRCRGLKCRMVLMRPAPDMDSGTQRQQGRRFHPDELVIAIADRSSLSRLLGVLEGDAEVLSLRCSGLVQEEVCVQGALYRLATRCLVAASPFLLPAAPVTNSTGNVTACTSTTPDETSTSVPPLPRPLHPAPVPGDATPAPLPSAPLSLSGSPLPTRVRIVGHSSGGGVGALMAAVLDGSLNVSSPAAVAPFVGLLPRGMVRCVALGPPPCLSRAVVPRAVTSILCGDDVVPRATPEALRVFRGRVFRTVTARCSSNPLDWIPVGDWISDATSLAGATD